MNAQNEITVFFPVSPLQPGQFQYSNAKRWGSRRGFKIRKAVFRERQGLLVADFSVEANQ